VFQLKTGDDARQSRPRRFFDLLYGNSQSSDYICWVILNFWVSLERPGPHSLRVCGFELQPYR
jgi:hypothetical protein